MNDQPPTKKSSNFKKLCRKAPLLFKILIFFGLLSFFFVGNKKHFAYFFPRFISFIAAFFSAFAYFAFIAFIALLCRHIFRRSLFSCISSIQHYVQFTLLCYFSVEVSFISFKYVCATSDLPARLKMIY